MSRVPAAVVTSYRPGDELLGAVESLRGQVSSVIVVDDGSGPDAVSVLDAAEAIGARVIRLDENGGIAAALNVGIAAALAAGADAVVTLDQDSAVPDGFVEALCATHDTARDAGHGNSPVVPEYFAGVRQVRGSEPDGTLLARGAIQSGMLLPREVLERVGLMRADLFIDLVDTEYELRCRAAGQPVIAAAGLRLAHSLGARYRRRGRVPLPGIPRVLTLSTPFRYYYRARNRVLIDRAYRRRFPVRMFRDALVDRLYFVVVVSLAQPRGAMVEILREGSRAGRRGEGGRIPGDLAQLAASIRWAADRVE